MLAGHELQFVQNLKYLGVQFLAAKKLKCSVDNTKLKFYRTFYAIYSRRTDRQTDRQTVCPGLTANTGQRSTGPQKTFVRRPRDFPASQQYIKASTEGDAENARYENARNAIVWNTECCICLSIAEQECMSRQERGPD